MNSLRRTEFGVQPSDGGFKMVPATHSIHIEPMAQYCAEGMCQLSGGPGAHWATPPLFFFDSLGGRNQAAVEAVKRWVVGEAKDKLNEDWDTSDWITEYPQDIPHQQNGCDCGAFTLLFINRLAVCGGAFDFVQADLLQHARVAITCDLLDGGIHATRTHHHNHQHQ